MADGPRPARGQAFPRARRLKRRRLIRPLFDRARPDVGRVRVGVVHLVYRLVPRADAGVDTPLQVGFAPGRRARTNAGRTRLRRHMREAFRLHQGPVLEALRARPDGQGLALVGMVLFRGREETAGPDLRRDLPEALRRLALRAAHEPMGNVLGEAAPPHASGS